MLVPRPSKIVCIGRNYTEHAKELGHDLTPDLLFFLKPPSSLIADAEEIVLPPQSRRVDFEGEIGLILGATLKNATEADAERAVRAVVAVNDVTARDLQKTDSQWTRAKGFDTFCPTGEPLSGQFDLKTLQVVTRVNGVERQRGSSSEMIYPIAYALSYISHIMTLEAGDLVATGTPAGVGPLSSGDEVEVEVLGISRVRNRVRG